MGYIYDCFKESYHYGRKAIILLELALRNKGFVIEGPENKEEALRYAGEKLREYLKTLSSEKEIKAIKDKGWMHPMAYITLQRSGGSFIDIVFEELAKAERGTALHEGIFQFAVALGQEESKASKLLSRSIENAKYIYIDKKLDTAQDAYNAIFKDNGNAVKFFEAASLWRLANGYKQSNYSRYPPLQYALKHDFTYKIGRNLHICPVTESFRRHIIFGTGENGEVIFKFEVIMPGQDKDRRDPYLIDRYKIAKELEERYPGRDYCPKPIGEPIRYPNGVYNVYGESVEFNDECPLRVMAFEYEDGKRLLNINVNMLNELAGKLFIEKKALERKIVEMAAELMAATHALGYIGHIHNGKDDTHVDHHLENFRLVVNDDGSFKLVLVGDFGVFEKDSSFKYPRQERLYDIRQVVLKCGAYHGLSRYIPSCTMKKFMSVYNKYFRRFKKAKETPSVDEVPKDGGDSRKRAGTVDDIIDAVVGGIDKEKQLADSLRMIFRSCGTLSDKNIVLAFEKGLGGQYFKMSSFLKALKECKEAIIKSQKPEVREETRKKMERIKVVYYKGGKDLKDRLGDSVNAGSRDLVLAFTNNETTAQEAKGLGEAVRPVLIKENGKFDNYYYPLAEAVAITLARELLKLDTNTLLESLAGRKVDIVSLGIETVCDGTSKDAAYLIFTFIPRIERLGIDEHSGRFEKLMLFLESA